MKVFHVAAKGLGPVLALILGSVVLLSSGCTDTTVGERTVGGALLGVFEEKPIDKELAALDLDESHFAVSEVLRDSLRGRVNEEYSIEFEKGWGIITYEHLIDGDFARVRTIAEGAKSLRDIFDVTIVSQDVKKIRGRVATFYVAFLIFDAAYCGFFYVSFPNSSLAGQGWLCRSEPLTEKVKAEHRTHVEDFLFRMEKH